MKSVIIASLLVFISAAASAQQVQQQVHINADVGRLGLETRSNANPVEETWENRALEMAAADGNDANVQASLARSYLYGLKNVQINKAEAFFWYSLCNSTIQKTMSFNEGLAKLEESVVDYMVAGEEAEKHAERFMSHVMNDPLIKRSCEDYVTVLTPGMTQAEIKTIKARVDAWRAKYPLPDVPVRSENDIRKNFLYRRLLLEMRDKNYDMEGINAILDELDKVEDPRGKAAISNGILAEAVANDNAEFIKALTGRGWNTSESLQNALTKAVENGKASAVTVLLTLGANLTEDLPNKGLLVALKNGTSEDVDKWVLKGAHLPAEAFERGGLLNALVQERRTEMLSKFVSLGGDINDTGQFPPEPIFSAVQNGDITTFNEMMKLGFKIKSPVQFGELLHHAAIYKKIDMLKRLMEFGSAGELDERQQQHVITGAFSSKNGDIFKYLISQGFKPSQGQMDDIKKCDFVPVICPDGSQVFSGPPSCRPDFCPVHIKSSTSTDVEVSNPSNEINRAIVDTLTHGSSGEKTEAIKRIIASPGEYNPHTLNVMASVLFSKFRDDEGIFWQMAATLRSLEDKYVCKKTGQFDIHDREVGESDVYKSVYKIGEPEKILAKVNDIFAWDDKTPVSYNQQWGMSPTECINVNRQSAARKWQQREFKSYYVPHDEPPQDAEKNNMDELQAAAQKGDAKAQFTLALCYANMSCRHPAADTVAEDADHARQEKEWEGHSTASYVAHYKPSVPDDEKSLYWLKKSAEQGNISAQKWLLQSLVSSRKPEEIEKGTILTWQMFKAGIPMAADTMYQVICAEELRELTQPEKKSHKCSYSSDAWAMFRRMIVPGPYQPFWSNASDADFNASKVEAENLFKKYAPVFGSSRSAKAGGNYFAK